MRLTLSVLSLQGQAPFTSMTHSFDQAGGSVGRHQRANWVLLDDKKFLSGEHFKINCDGKDFYIVDTSTNGTFVNDSIHPLGKNNSHRLSEKDQIKIGEYIIIASLFLDSASSTSDFPDNNYSHSTSDDYSNDPFFSSGDSFNDSPSPSNNNQDNDPFPGASKSSFVDPNLAGDFGRASLVEESSDPFFSSDDSFSPHATPFRKDLDKNIVEADNPLNINTPLTFDKNSQSAPSQKTSNNSINDSGIENNISSKEDDVFDFFADMPVSQKASNNSIDDSNTENNISAKEDDVSDFFADTPAADTPPFSPPETESIAKDNFLPEEEPNPEVKTHSPEVAIDLAKGNINLSKEEELKTHIESKHPPTKTDEKAVSLEAEALSKFLKGAGITQKHLPREVSADTFELIGGMLKEVLQGTIELLRARAETKNHLHLDRTIIGSVENNPLKFMPNAEQVIIHLLTKENQDNTYTPLDKALEEAFDDIMAHQYAMTVATQSALKGVIKQHFSPQNLEESIVKDHPISSIIPLRRQAKLWSMFEELYSNVEKEAAESFERLLDNEMSSAYQKQLMELQSLRIKQNNDGFPK